jgi:hypothetical protein
VIFRTGQHCHRFYKNRKYTTEYPPFSPTLLFPMLPDSPSDPITIGWRQPGGLIFYSLRPLYTVYTPVSRGLKRWHIIFCHISNNCMEPDLRPYSTILGKGKSISRTDFIYRLKSFFDCTEEKHRKLLQFLYKTDISQVRRDERDRIIFE